MFAGDPHHPAARELAGSAPSTIAVWETTDWRETICQANQHRNVESMPRTDFDTATLDVGRLRGMKRHADSDFHIESITLAFARLMAQHRVSGFSKFGSVERFAETGFGYFGIVGEAVACTAFSGAACQRGISVQISTQPDYRRRGYATAVGATLIVECLERELIPDWSAANTISADLARKLGYRERESYEDLLVRD